MTGHTGIEYDPDTVGAWQFGRYRRTRPRMGIAVADITADTPFDVRRVGWAVRGIQRMMAAQDYTRESQPYVPGVFGYTTELAVKRVQRDMGIRRRFRDGQAGRDVVIHLCATPIRRHAAANGIPDGVVAGQLYWESGFDPAAVGFLHHEDWGLGQFNMDVGTQFRDIGYHAFDAVTAIQLVCRRLGIRYRDFLEKTNDPDLALDCAIAAHNSPADAIVWADTGEPPDEQIATYVARIKGQFPDGV